MIERRAQKTIALLIQNIPKKQATIDNPRKTLQSIKLLLIKGMANITIVKIGKKYKQAGKI